MASNLSLFILPQQRKRGSDPTLLPKPAVLPQSQHYKQFIIRPLGHVLGRATVPLIKGHCLVSACKWLFPIFLSCSANSDTKALISPGFHLSTKHLLTLYLCESDCRDSTTGQELGLRFYLFKYINTETCLGISPAFACFPTTLCHVLIIFSHGNHQVIVP